MENEKQAPAEAKIVPEILDAEAPLDEAALDKVTGGNRAQAEKRLSDHRNEMRRNWAP